MNNINITIMQGLVVKPGDKLLIALDNDWTEEALSEARAEMRKRFPDTEVTFVNGAVGIMSLPAEVAEVLSTSEVLPEPSSEWYHLPHSRACGMGCNGHDPESAALCAADCPTCVRTGAKTRLRYYGTREEDLGVEDIAGRTPMGGA